MRRLFRLFALIVVGSGLLLCFCGWASSTLFPTARREGTATTRTSPVAASATRPLSTRLPTRTPHPSQPTAPAGSTATARPRYVTRPKYLPLLGHLFDGVKVYYGSAKTYIFEVLGGSENCSIMPSGRGVLVRYPDGSEEWKDRRYLIESGLYFVRSDDPNRSMFLWTERSDCP